MVYMLYCILLTIAGALDRLVGVQYEYLTATVTQLSVSYQWMHKNA